MSWYSEITLPTAIGGFFAEVSSDRNSVPSPQTIPQVANIHAKSFVFIWFSSSSLGLDLFVNLVGSLQISKIDLGKIHGRCSRSYSGGLSNYSLALGLGVCTWRSHEWGARLFFWLCLRDDLRGPGSGGWETPHAQFRNASSMGRRGTRSSRSGPKDIPTLSVSTVESSSPTGALIICQEEAMEDWPSITKAIRLWSGRNRWDWLQRCANTGIEVVVMATPRRCSMPNVQSVWCGPTQPVGTSIRNGWVSSVSLQVAIWFPRHYAIDGRGCKRRGPDRA